MSLATWIFGNLVILVLLLTWRVWTLEQRIKKLEAIIPRTVWAALEKAREARDGK